MEREGEYELTSMMVWFCFCLCFSDDRLIQYCKTTMDPLVPSVWGPVPKNEDRFGEFSRFEQMRTEEEEEERGKVGRDRLPCRRLSSSIYSFRREDARAHQYLHVALIGFFSSTTSSRRRMLHRRLRRARTNARAQHVCLVARFASGPSRFLVLFARYPRLCSFSPSIVFPVILSLPASVAFLLSQTAIN